MKSLTTCSSQEWTVNARNTSLFDGSVALQLTDSVDQNLMRLASAAAGKDLSEFFERWGYEPDSRNPCIYGTV